MIKNALRLIAPTAIIVIGVTTLAISQNFQGLIGTDKILGRDTAGTGQVEQIGVTGGIEFSGSGSIRTSAFTGDVTKTAGGTVLTVSDAELACIAALVSAADKVPYFTGSGTCALADLPAALRTFQTTSSSANLAALLTDETGTGAAVFATSPSLTTPSLGAATATTINKVTITAPATGSTLTIPDGVTMTGPASSGTVATLGNTETITGVKTFGSAGAVGRLKIAGTTSGSTTLDATAAASGTLTLPAATDTLVGKATTDTFTNKTFDTAGTGNSFSINGLAATANSGTGSVVRATSPTLVTPTLGVASATTVNKVTITAPATGSTLTIPDGVTLTGPAASGTAATLGNAETFTGVKTFGSAGAVGKLAIAGNTSGSTVLNASATASGTLTLPAATDTLVGKATTDTFTNKTFDTAGTGNSFSINGLAATANSGTGSVVRATSPALVTPDLGTPSALTLTNATGLPTAGIVNNAVTNAKLAQMVASSFKCRVTASTGDPEDCSATQATSVLNAMVGDSGTGGTKGLVPAPAAGDAAAGKYLKADGTFAVPPGSANSDGDKGDITVSGSGATWTIDNTAVTYAKIQNIAALSLMGRSANTSGVGADITAANDAEILRRSGTSIGFGSIDLASSGAVGTSILAGGNGGTGNAFMSFTGPATSAKTYTLPNVSETIATLGQAQTFTGVKTFGSAGAVGKLAIAGTTSGSTVLDASAVASGTLTLPAATDTLVGKATTDTLTNKTFDTAGAGNSFSINGLAATANTGTGSVVRATSPTLVTPTIGVATATTVNKVTITAPATGSTLTIPDGVTLTGPASSGTAMTLGNAETVTGVKTFGSAGAVGKLAVAGTTSGSTILNASATASGTLTLPAATDTLVGKATTDTFTNKTFDTAGTGNSFSINGVAATANTGTGAVVRETSPTLVTPNLGIPSTLTLTNATGLPTAGLVDAAVTYAKIQNLGALALMGRSANTSGVGADITAVAGSSCAYRESSNTIGCGTLATAALANSAVTYAKIQDISVTQRVLGRNSAGSGVTEEVTAPQVLDWIGSTQGQILYRGASGWSVLSPGTSGQFLKTQGAAADPAWATIPGGGDLLSTNNLSDVANAATAFANIKQAATDTATGVVELATAAEVETGTDTTRAVTAAGVKAAITGKQTVDLLAAGLFKRTTNGASSYTAEKATNDVMVKGFEFSAGTEQAIQVHIPMPKSWDTTSTLSFKFYWTTATAGTGNVVWAARAACRNDDAALDAAYGTAATVTDGFLADGDQHITSAVTVTPGGTCGAETMMMIELYRVAADAADTYTQTAVLQAAAMTYITNAMTDD